MIVQWQDVTDPNNTITYATQSISAGSSTASYSISPYTNLPGEGYTVQILVTVPSYDNSQFYDYITYNTSVSPLVVSV
jgi:hypothetical protein